MNQSNSRPYRWLFIGIVSVHQCCLNTVCACVCVCMRVCACVYLCVSVYVCVFTLTGSSASNVYEMRGHEGEGVNKHRLTTNLQTNETL